MAGLDDINPNDPAGTESPKLGDNRIRALAAKVIEAFNVEHALAGAHALLVGSAASRPAAGTAGRLYILTAAGVAVELQYDTGAAWVTITTNQTVSEYSTNLATHIAASPIDHPDSSITQAKIAHSAILKKHLDGSGDLTSLALLVNGGKADALHTHSATDQNIAVFTSSGTWTCPDGIFVVIAEEWAAGGGGALAYRPSGDEAGGGGGGGGYIKKNYTVVPESDYSVIVGLGGAGATAWHGNGLAGGLSSFDSTLIALGGSGGVNYGNTTGGGISHYPGQIGFPNSSMVGGAGGGFGGKGGPGGIYENESDGTVPGGGGGVGWFNQDYDKYAPGDGAAGLVIIRW